ncbi:uncharacterized protein N7482_003055 [Penicillium canariense]|uniref:Uncharacterized protein n=1 Tax=Penicillium canariense TaxID=189055 RepID=A0A9W9II72_9EURO|nr:uncharacterized protein N7482_003055 [Penicillium canariense]KAJ5177178.1 hypothetical protein N7482_003055 [Penicillium canariense]
MRLLAVIALIFTTLVIASPVDDIHGPLLPDEARCRHGYDSDVMNVTLVESVGNAVTRTFANVETLGILAFISHSFQQPVGISDRPGKVSRAGEEYQPGVGARPCAFNFRDASKIGINLEKLNTTFGPVDPMYIGEVWCRVTIATTSHLPESIATSTVQPPTSNTTTVISPAKDFPVLPQDFPDMSPEWDSHVCSTSTNGERHFTVKYRTIARHDLKRTNGSHYPSLNPRRSYVQGSALHSAKRFMSGFPKIAMAAYLIERRFQLSPPNDQKKPHPPLKFWGKHTVKIRDGQWGSLPQMQQFATGTSTMRP